MTEENTAQEKRNLLFLNIIITCIATTMMFTALATALPPIISDLDISVNAAQWLSSGYYLCMGIMVPISAFLISRFPTKGLYFLRFGLIHCRSDPLSFCDEFSPYDARQGAASGEMEFSRLWAGGLADDRPSR